MLNQFKFSSALLLFCLGVIASACSGRINSGATVKRNLPVGPPAQISESKSIVLLPRKTKICINEKGTKTCVPTGEAEAKDALDLITESMRGNGFYSKILMPTDFSKIIYGHKISLANLSTSEDLKKILQNPKHYASLNKSGIMYIILIDVVRETTTWGWETRKQTIYDSSCFRLPVGLKQYRERAYYHKILVVADVYFLPKMISIGEVKGTATVSGTQHGGGWLFLVPCIFPVLQDAKIETQIPPDTVLRGVGENLAYWFLGGS